VRAVVTDRKGLPVLGLTKDAFEVFEGGVAQEITFFSVERIRGPAGGPPDAAAAVGVAPAVTPGPAPAMCSAALYVDNVHLSFASSVNVRKAPKRFVLENLSDLDVLGIVTASGKVRLFGRFGNDRPTALEALDAISFAPRTARPAKFTPYLSSLIRQDDDRATEYGARLLEEQEGGPSGTGRGGVAMHNMDVRQARHVAREILAEESLRRRRVFDGLAWLCDQMAELPGRRAVWVKVPRPGR
jgi:VWFA-related protein